MLLTLRISGLIAVGLLTMLFIWKTSQRIRWFSALVTYALLGLIDDPWWLVVLVGIGWAISVWPDRWKRTAQ